MIAYNWFDCDKQPQPRIVNVLAGCVVPAAWSAPMNLSMLNVLPWIEWIAASRLGQAISASTWAFAVIESIHLLALSVIGGAVLMVDLRLLGLGLRTQPLADVARDAWPWFVGSWVVMIVTGVAAVRLGAAKLLLQHAVLVEDDLPAARRRSSRSPCGGR